jgi:hypothetical protein
MASLLGAWSAGEVLTRAGPLVVAIEESTYLTAVCPLVRLPAFIRVFAASVGAALEDLGISTDAAEREVMAIVEGVTFARNDNRSLLGSAIDVAWHASIQLEHARPVDLSELARATRAQRHAARESAALLSVAGGSFSVSHRSVSALIAGSGSGIEFRMDRRHHRRDGIGTRWSCKLRSSPIGRGKG